ncbi:MAG TPA: phage baseplate assembly protein V [Vicinamibacterales bacterium]|nr:phage baseplate assembly protein V [Vicinamibacterales bacterium]
MAEIGVARAVVVDNTDAQQGAGRVGVRFPWHSRPDAIHWAPIAAPMAGRDRGLWFRPEPGDEVLLAFERGDLRHPYVVGGVWSRSGPPPAPSAGGGRDLRMIRTRSGHTLVFDDADGGRVELSLGDGKRLAIDDRTVSLTDEHGNGLTIQSASGDVTVRAAGALRLEATQISIESSGPTSITSSAVLTLAGTLVHIN